MNLSEESFIKKGAGILSCFCYHRFIRGDNSMVEYLPSKQAVAGSSPVLRSIFSQGVGR